MRAEGERRARLTGWATAVLLGLLTACQSPIATDPDFVFPDKPYDFPFVDPFAATVVGTPVGFQADLPEADEINIRQLELDVFGNRPPPDVFWWNQRLQVSLVYQDRPAPLIIIIGGTGSGVNSPKTSIMQRAFFKAGFHVLALPSPTHPNFIVTASSTGVPGRIKDDTRDLYRVMQIALAEAKERVEVTDVHLTGFSLGGFQAAFVAKLDSEERAIGFKKTLVMYPPVSLFSSIKILDEMADENIPGGIENVGAFFDEVFQAFAEVFTAEDRVDFSGDFLYRVYTAREPKDEDLAALVGISFRLIATDMIFAADVMSRSNFMVPQPPPPTATSSLTVYFQVGLRVGFESYLNGLYYPYFKKSEPGLTLEALVAEGSFRRIERFLSTAPNVGLVANEDDIILAPGEIEYLEQIFGSRARIFPTGGHMGNLDHPTVVAHMTNFFRR